MVRCSSWRVNDLVVTTSFTMVVWVSRAHEACTSTASVVIFLNALMPHNQSTHHHTASIPHTQHHKHSASCCGHQAEVVTNLAHAHASSNQRPHRRPPPARTADLPPRLQCAGSCAASIRKRACCTPMARHPRPATGSVMVERQTHTNICPRRSTSSSNAFVPVHTASQTRTRSSGFCETENSTSPRPRASSLACLHGAHKTGSVVAAALLIVYY